MSTGTITAGSPVRPEDAAAVKELVQRITVSWAEGDADTLVTVYSQDASIVLPGATLKGRPEARDWMAQAFAGKWKNTKVLGSPKELRYISEDMMLLVSEGGAYPPGATEVPVEHAIRGMWLFIRCDGQWLIHAYANTPVGNSIPLPDSVR